MSGLPDHDGAQQRNLEGALHGEPSPQPFSQSPPPRSDVGKSVDNVMEELRVEAERWSPSRVPPFNQPTDEVKELRTQCAVVSAKLHRAVASLSKLAELVEKDTMQRTCGVSLSRALEESLATLRDLGATQEEDAPAPPVTKVFDMSDVTTLREASSDLSRMAERLEQALASKRT